MNIMMGKNRKSIFAVIVLVAVLITVISADMIRSRDPYFTAADMAMGSEITVKAYGFGKNKAVESVIKQIKAEDAEYWSRHEKNSVVSKLNAAEYSMIVDSRVIQILNEIAGICKDANGEIDLTIGALTDLWGFDTPSPSVPGAEEIAAALETVGYSNLTIDGTNVFIRNGGQLDLGAFGKGIACDIAKDIFINSNIKGGMVSAGGSVYVYGKPQDKEAWAVGIRNPDGTVNEYFAVIEMSDSSISTSGAYEKGFTFNGKYYHHILSPQTGMPVNSEFKSVSVISKSGLISDALSTACFILGYEKSLELLKEYDCEAVFVYPDNSVVVTSGLLNKITISDRSFTLKEPE